MALTMNPSAPLSATFPPGSANANHEAALAELSDRCAVVMELLTDGHSNKEIAHRLQISLATVKAHISSILRALDVDNRTQAALIGLKLRYGLDTTPEASLKR